MTPRAQVTERSQVAVTGSPLQLGIVKVTMTEFVAQNEYVVVLLKLPLF